MSLQNELHGSVKINALVFLNKAIGELASHDDSLDAPLDQSVATISSALLQVAFELSLVAYAVRKEGVGSILKPKDRNCSESEIRDRFLRNELKTLGFEYLLSQFSKSLFTEDELEHIKTFQNTRNKLMHLAHPFAESDRYDLKYELIYFTCKLLLPLISESEQYLTPAQVINGYIDKEAFAKLISFPPFVSAMGFVEQIE